jgi:hypothetical protein
MTTTVYNHWGDVPTIDIDAIDVVFDDQPRHVAQEGILVGIGF